MKMCFRCQMEYPDEMFNRRGKGLNSWCRLCEIDRNEKRKGPRMCVRRRGPDAKLCPRCLIRERGKQPYCPQCKKDYQNEHLSKKWSERYKDNEEKRIATVRFYATGLLARGKIRRGPCVFCGKSGTQFHHYDYERKTRNFEDVCYRCHLRIHRWLQFTVDSYRFYGVKLPLAA